MADAETWDGCGVADFRYGFTAEMVQIFPRYSDTYVFAARADIFNVDVERHLVLGVFSFQRRCR